MEEEERIRKSMEAMRGQSWAERGGTAAIVERSGIDAAALCVTKREEGKKDDRCFRGSVDTVEMLRAFLIMHFHENGIETRNIGLSTNSPMCDVRRTPRQ